jgi:hypothetical protein
MIPPTLEAAIAREGQECMERLTVLADELKQAPPSDAFPLIFEAYQRTRDYIGLLRAVQHFGTISEIQKYAGAELELQEKSTALAARAVGHVSWCHERLDRAAKALDSAAKTIEAQKGMIGLQESAIRKYEATVESYARLVEQYKRLVELLKGGGHG